MVEHGMGQDGQSPFGALRIPASVEALRNSGNKMHAGVVSQRLELLAQREHPAERLPSLDVKMFGDCRAWLNPRSNSSEKRSSPGTLRAWDSAECGAISSLLRQAPASHPFVFVDCGANAGQYSLYVAAEARRLKRNARVIAMEPDAANLRRLRFNIAASQAYEITVEPFALGVEANLSGAPVRPLRHILVVAGADHADLLKINVEGSEFHALRALFAEATKDLWPGMIILEARRNKVPAEAIHLCNDAGYVQLRRTGINALLIRRDMNNGTNILTMDR